MMSKGLAVVSLGLAAGCSDWIMNDQYGLSVRTMDLGFGPTFGLKTQPRGHDAGMANIPPAKFGHIISVGKNVTTAQSRSPLRLSSYLQGDDMAFAGLNEKGLSCDLHALLNSSYPPPSNTSKDVLLKYFCNWALGGFASTADVKAALVAKEIHLWGPASLQVTNTH